MALTEQKIVKQVTILPTQNSINVQWANQILRDSEVITETLERKAYMQEQKEEFLTEVENAEVYLKTLNW